MLFALIFAFNSYAAPVAVIGTVHSIASLDPFTLTGIDSYVATGYVLETLARNDLRAGKLEPALARSWTFDPKEKVFRVKLRGDVSFHDGSKFTAEDVKFTFEAYFNPAYRGQVWQGMWRDVEAVRVIDPLTVEFKLKEWRFETFRSVMTAMRILPRSFYALANQKEFARKIVGTGPFRFRSFKPNGILELDGAKHGLRIKHVPDAKLADEMRAKGELDFYPVPAAGNFRVKRSRTGMGTGFSVEFNHREPIFQSRDLRLALLSLWRREELNLKVFKGELELALDVFSPNNAFYPAGKAIAPDLAEARKLLEKDGWRDSDKDSVLDKVVQGKKRDLEFRVLATTAAQERWLTLFQNDAARAGVRVRIERAEDDAQFYDRLKEGKFQAAANDGGLMNEVTRLTWHSEGPYNFGRYKNPELDKLIDRLEGEFDAEKRRLILRKAVLLIREDVAVLPGLISRDEIFIVSDRLIIDPERPADPSKWQLR